uniref:Toll family protein 7 n=1 Tax=Oncopeltus fasciatus TaxID=7536 RepID=A0A173ADU3_ONCFA|nr:toll family protein 7 [Oncopeltus fasciatus]
MMCATDTLLGGLAVAVLLSLATSSDIGDQCRSVIEANETKGTFACDFKTLDIESGNMKQVPVDGTLRLRMRCSDALIPSPLASRTFFRLHYLEELSITNCKILEIPTDTFDGLRELKILRINTNNADWGLGKTLEMTVDSFDGLKQLQTLELVRSNVRRVPDNVFCTLGNLQTINYTRNSIRDLDSIGFVSKRAREAATTVARVECSGGMDLRALDLSYNEIRTLGEGSGISGLRRLQNLYLQNNQISEISSDAFSGLASLRVLNLSSNRLETLPEGLFAGNRDLSAIHLQNNSLYELARGIFHRLEQLIILDLSSNQLNSNQIDEGTFVGLIRLVILNLSNNALTRIDARTFKDLFFLQILDLRNNSIGFIEDNAFLPLYNLHTLNIAENRLHHITAHLFNGLFVLAKLTLNNNLIVNIDSQAFKNCSDLKELDLSSNDIQEVPEALHELSLLKTLDLGENEISNFQNGSFRGLSQLTGLRLIDNNIGNLTESMFWDLTGLQVLNLAKNKIQQIERGTFDRNTELEAIRLDANFLTDVNGVFTTIASLLWLNLSDNHLVWFDYAFLPSNLKWLDIHGNYIERLGDYYNIRDKLHIKTLDASHNRITEINEHSIPNSIEVIFINNNFISNIHVNSFFGKTNLARADIYANEINKLDLNALRLRPVPLNKTLPEFYLGGNPFICDCSMDWLPDVNEMSESQRQYPKVMDLDNVMCRMTYSRGTVHMLATDAKPSEFLCKYETHCFALCHCCVFDACDCEMTCPQNCTCYHDQTWNTNVVDCSRRDSDLIPRRIPMDATHVYLDGNNLKELQNHVFIGRKNMRVLFVNASRIETIQNRTFNGVNTLVSLHLEDNLIAELKGYEFEHLGHLKELYLQNNLISHISNMTLLPLKSLKILRLEGNRLVTFPVWQLTLNSYLVDISLGNNLWSCKCKFLTELQTWVADNRQKVSDTEDLWCYGNDTKPPYRRPIDLNNTVCSDYFSGSSMIQNIIVSDYLPMVVVTLSAFVIVIFLSILMFIFRDPLRVWLYSRYGVRFFQFKAASAKHYGEDREKLYDGYVVYSPKDEEFVLQSIVAELEHGSPSFQLCLHYRDLPHHAVSNSPYMQHTSPVVVEAAEASKRVILVLSRNFLQTEWSRFEFRSALHEALKGRIFKLVLVEEGSILPEAELDPDLRPYLKTGARLRWGEKRFWERLRYVMPSGDNPRKSCNYRRNINNYSLEGVPHRGTHQHAYLGDKGQQVSPSLQQHINSHPLFKAAAATNEAPPYSASSTLSRGQQQQQQEDPNYSSATTATPSPRPLHRHHGYANPERPGSEHIYSSIDSPEYPQFERTDSRRANGAPPVHQQSWRSGPSVVDTSGVQAYLV